MHTDFTSKDSDIGIPFPLALARTPPMRGARNVVDIANAYHQIAGGAPADDLLMASLYAYIDLRPDLRDLELMLSLIRSPRRAETISPTVPGTVLETISTTEEAPCKP